MQMSAVVYNRGNSEHYILCTELLISLSTRFTFCSVTKQMKIEAFTKIQVSDN